MSTTLTLQLPDRLKSQLLQHAQQLNISPETLALQSLAQGLNADPVPQSKPSFEDFCAVANLMEQLREARQASQTHITVDATPITLHLATLMGQEGQLNRLELIGDAPHQQMMLEINLNDSSTLPQTQTLTQLDEADYPPQLHLALQNLKNPDPAVRKQAIQALGDLYRGLS
ncbi:MAG: hypothetical protein AAGG51_29490 [Cyanobacteria bacterium P01_G01_bin.54]